MEFKSQICTTKEQSERLLAMGLKADTADMMWSAITVIRNRPVQLPSWQLSPVYFPHKSSFLREDEEQVFIPAWSLHRLMEILPFEPYLKDFNTEFQYDAMLVHIANAIGQGLINPEYLEEKK